MAANEHVHELIPGFVLGCLDDDELTLVAEHVAGCAACRAELGAYQVVVDQLALALPQATPSPAVKRRLMQRAQPVLTRPAWRQSLAGFVYRTLPVWGVACLILIIILAVSSTFLWRRVKQLEALVQPPALQTVNLAGTQVAPDASGLIVVSLDGKHGTLVVDRLPWLDAGHQYQLWLIQNSHRDSGAVFSVNKDGYGSVWVSSPSPLASYSDFGISIEPAGGSPGPTGDKVLGGTIQ